MLNTQKKGAEMATYVFSDVHGHAAPLDRLLERVSPSDGDAIYMLGDMIDRGPDPLRVMQLCRNLPGCTTLRGNHEDLMLSFFEKPHDAMAQFNWVINGGGTTAEQLAELPGAECAEWLEWVESLPLSAQDVWDIWEGIPDTYRYRKGGVTQIQLLSDELRGVCYELDNKYGSRDLRILVYGAKLTNDREQDKALVREQMETALSGECLKTKR